MPLIHDAANRPPLCSVCGERVPDVQPSHGGKILEVWHADCSPFAGAALKRKTE